MAGSISERSKNILDQVPCGICQVALDDNLTILYANQFYYDIYGCTSQNAEEQGFTMARFILPEDYQEIHRKVLGYVSSGKTKFQIEFRGMHSSGKIIWLLVQCAYAPDSPECILCSLMDIADRKRMEEEIRMGMEESRIAFELTDKQMFIFDIENKRLFQPDSVAKEFDLPPVYLKPLNKYTETVRYIAEHYAYEGDRAGVIIKYIMERQKSCSRQKILHEKTVQASVYAV